MIEALGVNPSRPSEAIFLGDRKLLTLDLSQASRHFGVQAPPSKRDRKSGATKRKQADIEEELNASRVAHG
jgi:DNA (cytosine-5)-methyltransferase 1